MATRKKDVELALRVTTDGADAVKGLTTSLRDLAKEGGDAAPEFQRLAAELEKVGGQSDTIAAFAALKRSVADTSNEMLQAAQRVDQLGKELPDAAAKTQLFAEAQDTARTTLNATKSLLDAARVSLSELRQEYPKGSRNVDEYRTANGELQNTIKTLGVEVSRLKAEYKESQSAAREAAVEERKLVTEYNQSLNSARQVSAELGRKTQALNASRDALAREGIATTDLVAAQNQLRNSFTQIKGQIDQRADAYKKSVTATQQLVQAEKLLVAELEFESRAAREAAAAEAALTAKRQEAVASLKAQAVATEATINQAFSKTGVRSAQAIESEIRQINEALNKLAFNARVSGAEFDRAFSAGQGKIAKLRAELDGTVASTSKASGGFSVLSGALNPAVAGAAAAAAAIGTLGRGAVQSVIQLESLRRSLTLVTGSTSAANAQIELLRNTANTSGIAIGSISDSFVRFNASTRTAGIAGKVVEDVFTGVTNAGAKLGLSGDRVGLSLDALSQIAAKGTVSLEELRQQLGDSFPGALDVAAKGLGITQKELIKLVESGQLLAEDFLPAFGAQLKKQFGDSSQQVDGLAQAWARFKNQLTLTGQTLGEGAIGEGLGNIASVAEKTFSALQVALVGLDKGLGAVRDSFSSIVGLFSNGAGSLSQVADEIGVAWRGAVVDLLRYADQSGIATTELGKQILAEDDKRKATEASRVATVAATEAAKAALPASAALSAQTVLTAASAADLVAKIEASSNAIREGVDPATQLSLRYTEQSATAKLLLADTEKLAAAKKIEGDTAVKLAQLAGDEALARQVAVDASVAYQAAVEAVTRAEEAALLITQRRVEELKKEADAKGGASDAVKAQIEGLQKEIETKTVAVEKSRQLTNSAVQEAAAARLAAVAYQDNSKRIGEFRTEVEKAQVALDEIKKRFETDKSLKGEVDKATTALALANGKLKDAIDDVDKALQLTLGSLQADYDLRVQSLKLKLVEAQADEDFAKAAGDVVLASIAKSRQIQIEADLTKLLVEQKNVLSQVEIEALNKKKLDLQLAGQLTPEIEREIDLRIKNLKVKQEEAKVDLAKGVRSETQAKRELNAETERSIRLGEQEARSRSSGGGGRTGGGGSSSGGNGGGGGGGTNEEKKPNFVSVSDAPASASNRNLDVLEQLLLKEKAGTLSAADAGTARSALEAATFNYEQVRSLPSTALGFNTFSNVQKQVENARRLLALTQAGPAPTLAGAVTPRQSTPPRAAAQPTGSAEARSAVEAATFNLDQGQNVSPVAQGTSGLADLQRQLADAKRLLELSKQESASPSTAPASPAPPASSRTVNINIGGLSASVNVASQRDSDALVGILRQVENASSRA